MPAGSPGSIRPSTWTPCSAHERSEHLDRRLRAGDRVGGSQVRASARAPRQRRDERRLRRLRHRRQSARGWWTTPTSSPSSASRASITPCDVEPQPVDEHGDDPGLGRCSAAGMVGVRVGHRPDRLLQRPGTVVEPLPIQRGSCRGHRRPIGCRRCSGAQARSTASSARQPRCVVVGAQGIQGRGRQRCAVTSARTTSCSRANASGAFRGRPTRSRDATRAPSRAVRPPNVRPPA